MADKDDKTPPSGPKKPTDREKAQVDAIPKRKDFFEWLERLFDGPSQFPEKIDTRVVTGPGYARLGPLIKSKIWATGDPKPKKGDVVKLSNELIFLMQRDCDIQRKQTVYSVFASHLARDTEYYERFLIRCQPGDTWAGGAHSTEVAAERREEEYDPEAQEHKHSNQILRHHETLFEMHVGGFQGLLDRYDRSERSLRDEVTSLRKENSELRNQLERALDLSDERAAKRRWESVKADAVERSVDKGFALAEMLIPALMSSGKSTVKIDVSEEIKTLSNFFKMKEDGGLLTTEQADAAFGVYDESKNLVKRGVLSPEQAEVLYRVAFGHLSPDTLDKILPGSGGPLAVTMEQLMALQNIFSKEQIDPLKAVFGERMKRRASQAQQAQQAQQGT